MTDHEWVGERLDVRLTDPPGHPGIGLTDLAGLAVRRNPRRAHLIVSQVLGKHIPVDPRIAYAAGRLLGERVARTLGAPGVPRPLSALAAALRGDRTALAGLAFAPDDVARPAVAPLVIGYAETATALGHAVADAFAGARYLHSTRRPIPDFPPVGTFDESHSHATEHLLLPADPDWLRDSAPIVLVDDELSTGRTAIATIEALQHIRPRRRYVVATLLDLRGHEDRIAFDRAARRVDTRIDVVSLATGTVSFPADVLERASTLIADLEPDDARGAAPAPVRRVDADWPVRLLSGGRHGFGAEGRGPLRTAVAALAEEVAADLPGTGTVLVLGTEELMYTPLQLGVELARRRGSVRFSSTTRSPVLPVNSAGYAIRSRLAFPAHDGADGTRYVYNVAGAGFAGVVLVIDRSADTAALWDADGLVERVRRECELLTVAVVPDHVPARVGALT
jgi:hypothetical protein